VLIANEAADALPTISEIVRGLGHEIVAEQADVTTVAQFTRDELPDVALVGLAVSHEQALEMIDRIVREAACPVIALLHAADPVFVQEAAKRGVFAYVIVDGDGEQLQSALDITLRRFAEYHSLEGAFRRRATIEQAKGILMERHKIDQERAFSLLRSHARKTNQKVTDVAEAITTGYLLLPDHPGEA
jgi:response regulator NasT